MKSTRKILYTVLMLILPFLLTADFLYSQDKDAPVNVKANVIVLNAENKSVDAVKQEDIKIYEDGVEQKITYFAEKEPVLNVGFVIDNSGSLRTKLNEIIFMGSAIVENLRPEDEAFFIRFISTDKVELIQDWTSDKKILTEDFRNMYVEGGRTAIIDAVYLSAEKILEREQQNRSKRYALILISDGVERNSRYKLNQLFSLLEKSDVQIFSISFPEDYARKQARKGDGGFILLNNTLAAETGGTAFTLSEKYTKDEIIGNLKALILELRSNYILGYTSTNRKRDGKERTLRVEIADDKNGTKRRGFVRENFKFSTEKDLSK